MKNIAITPKTVIGKIIWVVVFQLIAYAILAILSNRRWPFSDPAKNSFFVEVTVGIVFLFWLIFLVDQIRYWFLGAPLFYALLMYYTNLNAVFYVNHLRSGFMSGPETDAFIYTFFVFAGQAVLCAIKWFVVSRRNERNRKAENKSENES